MSELTQVGFDYAALPVDLSVSLRIHADRYVAVRNRAAYEMGKEIYEAQQELASHDKTQGQFGAWVESLGISRHTGYDLITLYQGIGSDVVKLFDNKKLSQTVSVMLLRSPEAVIDKAVAKVESGEKVTVADVKDWKALEAELEIERQARLIAQEDKEILQRRNSEWADQSNEQRKRIKELVQKVDLFESQPKPEPVIVETVVEKIPDDYESVKRQAAELTTQTEALQKQLADLQKQQSKLVNDQVKAKLQGYQSELDKLEEQKRTIEGIVDRKKAYLDSLDSEVKRIAVHRDVIEEVRLKLINLAAFLEDLDPMHDPDTIRRWLALGEMNRKAWEAIRWVFGDRNESQDQDRQLQVVA